MQTAFSVKPASQVPARLAGVLYQGFLRDGIGDDEIAVIFLEGTLRGGVQGVRQRSSGALDDRKYCQHSRGFCESYQKGAG